MHVLHASTASGGFHAETVGDGSATTFTVVHNLGTVGVQVQCWLDSDLVLADVEVVNEDTVTVGTSPAVPTADQLTVTVVGAGDPADLGTVELAWVGATSG